MVRSKSIKLSPKHGINPSVLHCIACGKDYGVAMLGKLKNDEEAPKDIYRGLCDKCQSVIDQGGVILIEVKDGETSNNPYRTGRMVGLNKDFKERNHLKAPIMYMEQHIFSSTFGNYCK